MRLPVLSVLVLAGSAVGVAGVLAVGCTADPIPTEAGAPAPSTSPSTDAAAPAKARLPVPATVSAACAAYAVASCAHEARCLPQWFAGLEGTIAHCEQHIAIECAVSEIAPGAAAMPAGCAAAVAAQSCESWAPLEACHRRGSRPDGAPCNFGSQCRTDSCVAPSRKACGVCTPVKVTVEAGAPCTSDEVCGPGDECRAGVCVDPRASEGEGCSAIGPWCGDQLACVNRKCVPVLGPGAPCGKYRGDDDPCDARQSLTCVAADGSDQGTCQRNELPDLGAPCDRVGWFSCRGNAECMGAEPARTCVAKPADGAPCTDRGPECAGPYSLCRSDVCTPVGPEICD